MASPCSRALRAAVAALSYVVGGPLASQSLEPFSGEVTVVHRFRTHDISPQQFDAEAAAFRKVASADTSDRRARNWASYWAEQFASDEFRGLLVEGVVPSRYSFIYGGSGFFRKEILEDEQGRPVTNLLLHDGKHRYIRQIAQGSSEIFEKLPGGPVQEFHVIEPDALAFRETFERLNAKATTVWSLRFFEGMLSDELRGIEGVVFPAWLRGRPARAVLDVREEGDVTKFSIGYFGYENRPYGKQHLVVRRGLPISYQMDVLLPFSGKTLRQHEISVVLGDRSARVPTLDEFAQIGRPASEMVDRTDGNLVTQLEGKDSKVERPVGVKRARPSESYGTSTDGLGWIEDAQSDEADSDAGDFWPVGIGSLLAIFCLLAYTAVRRRRDA